VSPKRLETLLKISAVSALFLCLPVEAQEQTGWQFDSLRANSTLAKPDAQQVYEVLLKMLDRWNAYDIEGHLDVYWKSAELLVVIDSEQFNGYQQLHDSYVNGNVGRLKYFLNTNTFYINVITVFYVYIAVSQAKPDHFYIGFSSRPEDRLEEHNAGKNPSTARFTPWLFANVISFQSKRALN
jgi:hypothetical protein